jgi:transcriptional regulator with XRE-family HTH domain
MSIIKRSDPKYILAYERGMLRSALVSLFWGVIAARKKRDGYTLQKLAGKLGTNKAEVSRWFNGDPNWTINTIASIANALDLELKIEAVERSTGLVFTPAGIQTISIQGLTTSKSESPPIQGNQVITETEKTREQIIKVTRPPKSAPLGIFASVSSQAA